MIRHIGVSERSLLDALKETIKRHCKATGDTREAIAQECGISVEYLGNMLNGTANFRLDVLLKICTLTNLDLFGIALARIRGASFVATAPGVVDCAAAGRCICECGEFVTAMGGAFQDGHVSETELQRLDSEGQQAIEIIQSVIATAHAQVRRATVRADF